MPQTPDTRYPLGDIAVAMALLTRIPVAATAQRGAAAVWAFPVAGAAVGLLAGLVGSLLVGIGLPAGFAAAGALVTLVIVTGAMHEDGLADSADGIWGGFDRARRLEIMKDSRIGTYGVLALVLSMILRWSLLVVLLTEHGGLIGTLIGVAALSRAPMGVLMAVMPNARGTGLSALQGRAARPVALAGCVAALAIALVTLGIGPTIAAGFGVALAGGAAAMIAQAKIGGQTGDILGASQQIAEIAALAALTLFI